MTRCPYRYCGHLFNPTTNWDSRCKLEQGHKGPHLEAGMIVPVQSEINTQGKSGWIKE